MGSSDRDYFRDERRRRISPPQPPVTRWLLWINAIVFLITVLGTTRAGGASALENWGAYTVHGMLHGQIWRIATFQFLHNDLGHILFNFLSLFAFGRFAEEWWGSRRFLGYYLLCNLVAAISYTLLVLIRLPLMDDIAQHLVGGTAGTYGTLITAALVAPKTQMRLLFPPITVTMRQIALFTLGLSAALVLISFLITLASGRGAVFENAGAEAAYLGGALAGYLFSRKPALLGRAGSGENYKILHPEEFKRTKKVVQPKLHPRSELNTAESTEVDRILDKINRDGFDSLTAEDREILNRASSGPKK